MPVRRAEATWKGGLKDGHGWVKSATGSVEGTFSAGSRFEDAQGTNPEELLGAAHAGCFSMQLSALLEQEGHKPQAVDTRAQVTIEKQGEGFAITKIALNTKVDAPGIDEGSFQSIAEKAKETCPVSQALKAVPVTLEAELVSS